MYVKDKTWMSKTGQQTLVQSHWDCYKQLKSALSAWTTELWFSSEHGRRSSPTTERWCKGWCYFYVLVWLAVFTSNCV